MNSEEETLERLKAYITRNKRVFSLESSLDDKVNALVCHIYCTGGDVTFRFIEHYGKNLRMIVRSIIEKV